MKILILSAIVVGMNLAAAESSVRNVISVTGEANQTCVGNDDSFCAYDASRFAIQKLFENADKACVNGYLTLSSPQTLVSERLPGNGVLSTAHVVVVVDIQCLPFGIAFDVTAESDYYPPWAGDAGPEQAQTIADQQANAHCRDEKGAQRVSTFKYSSKQKVGRPVLFKTIATAKYACLGQL